MSGSIAVAEDTTQQARQDENACGTKVAYVLSRFPKLTETFVLYEILSLEEQGISVEIYPLLGVRNASTRQGASLVGKLIELLRRRASPSIIHAEAEPLVRRAHYGPLFSWAILMAQFTFLSAKPRTYLAAIASLVRSTWGSWNFLLGGLAIFPKSAYLAREMQRAGVSRVHAHFANHPATSAYIINRLTGIPFSFTAHGSDLHVDRHMLSEKVRQSTSVVTISNYNKELILEECGEECRDKVEIIRCGVDTQVLKPSGVRRAASSDRDFAILCIGTMHEVKGQEYLVEACRLLKERGIRFTCHFVGSGPNRESLEEQARQAGLSKQVVFHGLRTRCEIAALLQRTDVLAAPSVQTQDGRREGIPVVLMEAMACGIPVVASRLSGIPELVDDGQCGLLVPPREANAIAEALTRLHDDPELCDRLGRAGREKVVDAFDVHKNAASLAKLLLNGAAGRLADDRSTPHQ